MDNSGHNLGAGFEALKAEAEALVEKCARLAGEEITAENSGIIRDALGEEVKLRKKLDNAKGEEKRPHLDANTEIEGRYKPVLSVISDAAKALNRRLTAYIEAEEKKRREEAERIRKAAEEEQRKAAEAAAALAAAQEPDPFEQFDAEQAKKDAEAAKARADEAAKLAAERVRVASAEGNTRATSLKSTWSAEITDAAALVAHYANRQSVIDAALSLANAEMRNTKGQAQIPGVKAHEERKVA